MSFGAHGDVFKGLRWGSKGANPVCALTEALAMRRYDNLASLLNTLHGDVDLYNRGIDDAGATALAHALIENETITGNFNLVENPIGDIGATALADALKINKRVFCVYISRSGISEEVKTKLELSCKRLSISRW
jgi:hypothetical protein